MLQYKKIMFVHWDPMFTKISIMIKMVIPYYVSLQSYCCRLLRLKEHLSRNPYKHRSRLETTRYKNYRQKEIRLKEHSGYSTDDSLICFYTGFATCELFYK